MSMQLRVTGSAPAAVKEQVERALLTAFDPPIFTQQQQSGMSLFHLLLDAQDAPLANPQQTPYDCRFMWAPESTMDEVLMEVRCLLEGRRFTSTRGAADASATFLSVVRDGLAPDGGLFNLQNIPRMAPSQLHYYCTFPTLNYIEAAQFVLERLVDASLPPQQLRALLVDAYAPSRWSGLSDVCPVTSLLPNTPAPPTEADSRSGACWHDVSLLELYHGPTAAFKDFALQLFPRYFDIAVKSDSGARSGSRSDNGLQHSYVILAATSGDTGVAAISGFANAGSSTRVMVLYPHRGVSPVQQMQMLSYDDGTSVRVFGAKSDFDFCQHSVKQIFANRALAQELWSDAGVRLSSANSINWGRLIPQVAYYFWAYRKFVQQDGDRRLHLGDPLDVVVPCGNFGNILAAFFAKRMGLPLGTLVVASNCNDVLCEFVQTGRYD
ncbi:threonine synthase, partial [Trypanosoma grayi]|uniref:threonine synthase n=1 Tax=Trypanosoma grayi TaxID=71804 RepID=UPI0004F3F63F